MKSLQDKNQLLGVNNIRMELKAYCNTEMDFHINKVESYRLFSLFTPVHCPCREIDTLDLSDVSIQHARKAEIHY